MSKQIETKKILVSNGQELIAKIKGYKSSGGEWKLLEFYYTGPAEGNEKREYEWGIIIENGKKEVNIKSVNNNEVNGEILNNGDSDGSRFLANVLDMNEVWDELCEIFPKAKPARNVPHYSLKKVKRDGENYLLGRYLVAEDFRHLKLIIRDYFRENEAKIYQSSNRNFSNWTEIVNGKDGNIYLYVGEKNSNDGREIKIGIKKSEFEKKKDSYFSTNELLETSWKSLIMSVSLSDKYPKTPDEKKTYYYQRTEEHWQAIQKFWKNACRFTLEGLRNRLIEKLDYLDSEPNEKEIRDTNKKITKVNQRLCYMKENHSNWYNNHDKFCYQCERRMCCDKDGHTCAKENQEVNYFCGENDIYQLPTLPKPNQKNNPISDTEKSQLRRYFLKHAIQQITLDNGKIVIEYNDQTQKTLELKDDQQLQKYQEFIQNQPNHSLSLEQLLKTNTSSSNPNPNNKNFVIGLTVGGIILMGVIIFSTLIIRKRNKKFSKN